MRGLSSGNRESGEEWNGRFVNGNNEIPTRYYRRHNLAIVHRLAAFSGITGNWLRRAGHSCVRPFRQSSRRRENFASNTTVVRDR